MKVANYTHSEQEFNTKWDVISDCMIEPKPTSISCVDGLAVLTY